MPRSSKSRRDILKATGAGSVALLAGCLGSDGGSDFPNEPITFKVIADTGGGMDYYTRLVTSYIEQEDLLDVDIRVENLTMSLIGRVNNVYNSDNDGYTYGNAWPGAGRFQAQGVEGVEFDYTDITPMPSAGSNMRAICVGPDVDVNSGSELLSHIANGNAMFYTTGVRSTGTIAPVILGEVGGAYDLTQVMDNHVVYDGQAQGMTGMQRGEVNTMAASVSSVIEFIRSGDLKPVLVMAGSQDEIPTLYEEELSDVDTLGSIELNNKDEVQGLTSFQHYWNWMGPPGIEEERADVIRDAMSEAIQMDELQEEARSNGRTITYADSETVGEYLGEQVELWEEYLPILDDMEAAVN
ncbi:Bug family tripartite tricarboxylate transporter substrate binding protein [Halovenus marina]|uniref:Bug family tripartite tricarboxylate transporter substrate binding protein n=1 Tax=Halovenus marina TaxID=3396621 RepID=UPI003F560DF6